MPALQEARSCWRCEGNARCAPVWVWVTEYAAPPVSQTLRNALSTAPASRRCTSENRVAATYAVAPTAVPRAAR